MSSRDEADRNLPSQAFEMVRILLNQYQQQMATRELATELSVTERTIRRYINQLQHFLECYGDLCNFPRPELIQIDGRSAVRLSGIRPVVSQPQFEEVAALSAVQHLSTIDPNVLGQGASEWMQQRLSGSASDEWLRHVRSVFFYRPFGAKRYSNAQAETLRTVILAGLERRALRVSYIGLDNQQSVKEINPLTVVLYRDGFYVLARERKAPRRIRILSIDRISHLEKLADTFERPADFDPRRYLNGDFGLWKSEKDRPKDIKILFTQDAARVAKERTWPGQSRWEDESDGQSILWMNVTMTPELTAWILSWGSQATVLEHDDLRAKILQSLQDSLRKYT